MKTIVMVSAAQDWWVRLVVGCGLILLLLAPVVSTIYYLLNI